jgi:hypothetical protein
MDHVVFKYPLETKEGTFQVPRGAKVVHCAMKDGRPNLWMECPHADKEHARAATFEQLSYRIVATGELFPPRYEHLGTFVHDDQFVWHVYRKPNEWADCR